MRLLTRCMSGAVVHSVMPAWHSDGRESDAPCARCAVQVVSGEWDVASVASHAYDIANKTVCSVGGGRIARAVLRRLKVRPHVPCHSVMRRAPARTDWHAGRACCRGSAFLANLGAATSGH